MPTAGVVAPGYIDPGYYVSYPIGRLALDVEAAPSVSLDVTATPVLELAVVAEDFSA